MMPFNFRDNVHKHKKEKEIDNFLIRKETKRAIELKTHVKEMEKVAEIKLNQKRMRDVEIKKEENIPKENDRSEQDQNNQEINIKDAVEKILKHIEKPIAYGKCLNLLKTLFLNIDIIQPLVIIKIFYKIFNLSYKFLDPANRTTLREIYEYTLKEFKRTNKEDQKFYVEMLSLFKLVFDIELNLITDDSFILNSSLKLLEKEFDALPIYNEIEEKELNYFTNAILCLKHRSEEDSDIIDPYDEKYSDASNLNLNKEIIFNGIKRWVISNCFKESFKLSSFKWALSSINNLLRKAYLEKAKHSPKQYEELENMVISLKNKNSSISNLNNKRAMIDNKIKDTPLQANHIVTDAREEKIVEYSIDKWQAKQAGLTQGRLFMNN